MELLIRIRDKVGTDVYRDCKLTKRGDVIDIRPDGHPWGRRELANPDWRIVRVPISANEAHALLAPEPGNRLTNRMLRKRLFRLDVDNASLPNNIKNWLRDDSRATPILDVAATRVRGIVQEKTPLSDPAVLGPLNENVIG